MLTLARRFTNPNPEDHALTDYATAKAIFLNITTSEKKIGLLLIETFKKPINTQNYGHQGSILGGLSCSAELVGRIDEEPNKMVKCKWVNK